MTKRSILLFVLVDIILLLIAALYFGSVYIGAAPTNFVPQTVEIAPGSSVQVIATQLEQQQIIRSAWALQLLFTIREDSTDIKAGTYVFDTPHTLQAVADILVEGQFANELVAVTFIEGATTAAFGAVANEQLQEFDLTTWQNLTAGYEGRLFPDTYHIPKTYDAASLVALLRAQHDEVIADLAATASTTLSQSDVVILASILEREANDEQSMRTVAGIFLNRLAIGMPLQADATIEYVLDTPLGELPPGQLATELREVDSPYNTYLYPGLPPTPIGNPGRQALAAVLNPVNSDYFYYITGDDGQFYYAETYPDHLANIERYLRP